MYHDISNRGRKSSLDTTEFLDRHVCINNPHWQSCEVLVFFANIYLYISNTLVGSFLDVFFLLFTVTLSGLHEKPRMKDWVTFPFH